MTDKFILSKYDNSRVGARSDRRGRLLGVASGRNLKTERSGSLEVNRDFVLGRRMHPANTLPH
jgi:hypothetical protein